MKEEGIIVNGIVSEALPNAMFRVLLANGSEVLCTICGKIRQKHIKILPDDNVQIEITPYDLTRGRITYRL